MFLILLFLFTGAYGRTLDEIKRSGKIYVAFSPGDMESIDYDLALEFARYLNVELIEVHIGWDEAFMRNGTIPSDLETNPELRYTPDALQKADIICSTFTVLEWRKKLFGFAETMKSAELLLINKEEDIPETFEDLANKRIAFQGSTSFETHLNEINRTLDEQMELVVTSSTEESKQLLVEGRVYGIVLDADEALTFNAGHEQQYKLAFPISDITRTAWALEKNNPLIQEVENFFETISSNGVLDDLFHKRFGLTYKSYVDQLNAGQKLDRYKRDLNEILASRKLVVALRERDFVYHENGPKQFMHALAEEFAEYLGVSLEFVVTPSFEKYWECDNGFVNRDSAYCPEWFNYFDLAAETFSPMEWRNNMVNMVPVYPTAYTVVARKGLEIESLNDLKNFRGVTAVETLYEDVLKSNGITDYYYEKVNNFLTDVVSGKADYTILYNSFAELSAYPELEEKLELGSVDVSWALRKDQPELQKELENFLRKSRQEGLIGILERALRGNSLQSPDAVINSYYESFQTGQLPYVNYGASNGLPQEDVFSIFQDQKGYMWFGTNSGAVRYNGREMQVFNHDHGLPGNSVRDIDQDSSGIMYFATTNGIVKFSGDSTIGILWEGISFHTIFIDSKDKRWCIGDDGIYQESPDGMYLNTGRTILPRVVYNITEDPGSEAILFATNEGVYMYDPLKEEISRLSSTDCNSLYIDAHDSIWMSTRDGLLIAHLSDLMNGEDNSRFHNLNERLDFPIHIISDIIPNRFGSVWLVADSRIMQLISTDLKPIIYEQDIGIMNNEILSFLIDKEDNIWIGFSGGLQRLSNRMGLRNFYPASINSFIYSVLQDKQQRMWVTSDNGIFYFNENRLHDFTPRLGSPNTKFAATLLANQNILFANNEGLFEVNSTTLEISRRKHFKQILHSVDNIFVTSKGEIFLLTGVDGIIYYFPDFYSPPRELKNKFTANIFQLIELNGKVFGGNNAGFVAFNGEQFELVQETECSIWSLYREGDKIWVGTDCGIGLVTDSRFDQMALSTFDRALMIKSILPAKNRNYLWLGTNKGFSYFNTENQKFEFTINTKDGLSGDEITSGGLYMDSKDLLWVGTYHGISNFNIRARSTQNFAPVCYIERLFLNGDRIQAEKERSFAHSENNFIFEMSALSFSDETSVEYEYYLRGSGDKYASYQRGNEYRAHYNNLPPGKYEFIYKAKGKNNIWGYTENYNFTIRKAWYDTWVFRISLVLLLGSSAYLFYLIRIRTIKNQKDKLELQVKERTREIHEQKDEIEAQHNKIEAQLEEIETQRDQIVVQRDQVVDQKQAITDSIAYAQKIQTAILRPASDIADFFSELFIIFQPRDVVSGDFYWFKEMNNSMVIVGADCTGHGVPGAFMSMLGVTLLNDELEGSDLVKPNEILVRLRTKVKDMLTQEGHIKDQKDGMDMAFISIDKEKRELQFAGANHPLYLIRNKEHAGGDGLDPYLSIENNQHKLYELKGDKQPIGVHWEETDFTNHIIKLEDQDTLYIFSDGIVDQYGGENRKKYKAFRFRKLLLSIQSESMEMQKCSIMSSFETWRGKQEQIDDVSVIGLRL